MSLCIIVKHRLEKDQMPLGGAEGLWLEKGESGVAARFIGPRTKWPL